jgi:hypothetical protein
VNLALAIARVIYQKNFTTSAGPHNIPLLQAKVIRPSSPHGILTGTLISGSISGEGVEGSGILSIKYRSEIILTR